MLITLCNQTNTYYNTGVWRTHLIYLIYLIYAKNKTDSKRMFLQLWTSSLPERVGSILIITHGQLSHAQSEKSILKRAVSLLQAGLNLGDKSVGRKNWAFFTEEESRGKWSRFEKWQQELLFRRPHCILSSDLLLKPDIFFTPTYLFN